MSATSEIRITADASDAIAEIRALRGEVDSLRTTLGETKAELDLARRSPRLSIIREPLTYDARLVRDRRGPRGFRAISTRQNHCYVRDLAKRDTDLGARERLDRHEQEMRKVGEAREAIFHPEVEYEFEQRAVNWSSGLGGYFAPPLWVVEWFAMQPTPERVLSDAAPCFELPVGVQSVNLPAWTTGIEVGLTQLGAPAATATTVDTAATSAVATIAGNYDVPLQMLEQSPAGAHLDWVAFTTMEARYGYQLELQLLVGTGVATPQGSGNSQLLGVFNNTQIPSGNQVTYTGAAEGTTTAATSMFSSLGLAIAKVGQTRLLPPELWMMSTARMGWLGSSEDTQNRPLMIADRDGAGVFDLIAIPVRLNDAIPRTLGSGQNEDRIIICRPSDWLILESEPRTQVMLEAISGQLMARLQYRRYTAAVLRRPESVAYLQGSGMATGGGF